MKFQSQQPPHQTITTRSDQDSENSETTCGDGPRPKLPPKKWKPIGGACGPSVWLFFFMYSFVVFVFTVLVAASGRWQGGRGTDSSPDKCSNDTANMSASERRFHIDNRVKQDLSFAQAKLIDLAWDMGAGHGGRLVHGWVLYHIACRTATWILESSALSSSTTIDLLLWPDSWTSLWSLVCSIFTKRPKRLLLALAFLAYSTAHVLVFPMVWSAAAGYQSNTLVAYPMPDMSWVTAETEELTVCWSLDPSDVQGIPIITDGPVIGPTLASFRISFTDLGTERMWRDYQPGRASVAFQDLHAYSRTKSAISSSLRGFSTSMPPDPMTRYWESPSATRDSDYGPLWAYFPLQDRDPQRRLPATIVGWRFPDGYYDHSSEANRGNDAGKREGPARTSMVTFPPAVFQLNSSVPLNRSIPLTASSVIPYNSTIWYNETSISLRAPFLEFNRDCRWFSSLLDECICYKGKPVTEDFRVESRLICTNGDRYYWGFSGFITLVGLILETVWCIVGVCLLHSSNRGSALIRNGRPATGVIRGILDVAEVINEQLGDNTCLYGDQELKEELSYAAPVGYAITERKDGVRHLGLASMPDGITRRRHLGVATCAEVRYG
ncbi:hypothetical protein OQA88_9953 [Cercophora sp. LCS_1]